MKPALNSEKTVVKTNDYEMEISLKKEVTLLKLLNNEEFRHEYFKNEDLDKYTAKNINKLKKIYEKGLKRKIKQQRKMLKKNYLPNEVHINILTNDEIDYMVAKDTLKEMEKKLGYLIYLDIISKEETKERGFDSEYIKTLLSNCEEELKNRFEKNFIYNGYEDRMLKEDLDYNKIKKLVK